MPFSDDDLDELLQFIRDADNDEDRRAAIRRYNALMREE